MVGLPQSDHHAWEEGLVVLSGFSFPAGRTGCSGEISPCGAAILGKGQCGQCVATSLTYDSLGGVLILNSC